LKTLEEPPEHVKFLLATTDPQKLPITILSRCLQFNLKALSRDQIKQQIKHILSAEEITYQDDGINHLAHAAQGSMRDALSLTDQAIASGNGQVSSEIVIAMLGLLDRNQLSKLLASALTQDATKTFEWVDSLANQSPDYNQLMSELLSLLHQIALTQFVPDACKLETSTPKVIYQLASQVSPEHVQLCYQIVLQGKRDLPHAADGRSGLEMTLLRMLAFKPTAQKKSSEIVNQLAVKDNETQDLVLSADTLESEKLPPTEPVTETELPSVNENLEASLESADHAQLLAQQDSIIQQAESLFGETSKKEKLVEVNHQETISVEDEADTSIPSSDEKHSDDFEEKEKLDESASFSSTASLIAMKQQLKELNKRELEKVEKDESSGERDFDSLSFSSKKTEKELPQIDNAQTIEPESRAESKGAEPNFIDDDDMPPFDMSSDMPIAVEEAHTVSNVDDSLLSTPKSVESGMLIETQEQEPQQGVDEKGPESFEEQIDPSIDFNVEDDVEVTILVEAFSQEGEKIVGAKQIDQWSSVIEQMEIRGLTKQLALHSNYLQNENLVTLLIAENKSHLNTDIARAQIKSSLESVMGTSIELNITFGVPENTPFAIQQKINKVRQQFAYQLLESDQNIATFKRQFEATVESESTFAR
jgi:DNA polymerase-3 subunit gamma/tau